MASPSNDIRAEIGRQVAGLVAIVGVTTAVIGIPALVYGEAWRARWASWIVVNGLWFIVAAFLLFVIFTRKAPQFLGIPRVISFHHDLKVLIVHGSPWLSMNVGVSIYVVEEDVERLVCVGEVQNVQTNNLVQIRLVEDSRSSFLHDDLEPFFVKTDVKKLLLKPALFQGI